MVYPINRKGQATIEFILILLLILIFGSMLLSKFNASENQARDVARAAEIRIALESISSAANELSNMAPNSKRIVEVLIPTNSSIKCRSNRSTIELVATVGQKQKSLPLPANTTCNLNISNTSNDVKPVSISVKKTQQGLNITELQS